MPDRPAPVFVSGRQHSGNTMLTASLGRMPGVFGAVGEGSYFERREAIAELDPADRARAVRRRVYWESNRALDVEVYRAVRAELAQAAEAGAGPDALYGLGLQTAIDRAEINRWVQKATSYVFYVDDIFAAFPDARVVFVLRNPLDLWASAKRRGASKKRHRTNLLRTAWGWRVGVARAVARQASAPDRFRIVRYEDLVRTPEPVLGDLCAFAGLPYHPDALGVDHVNKAEDKHALTSERKGFSAGRVFGYGAHLAASEEAAVRAVTRAGLGALYPELGADAGGLNPRAVARLGRDAVGLAANQAGLFYAAPRRTWHRLGRRLT